MAKKKEHWDQNYYPKRPQYQQKWEHIASSISIFAKFGMDIVPLDVTPRRTVLFI
jgi:hypothetical protein